MSMHVLVTWGSTRGGTEEIARVVAEALRMRGFDVVESEAKDAPDAEAFDAVIVGGALYANRWHRAARRYTSRNAKALRRRPTWMFSSGPLDDSAELAEIAPTQQVSVLMMRTGALGHKTFGGRLQPDAKGFIASRMAKTHAGDWRDFDAVRVWSNDIADHLLSAVPGYAQEPSERAVPRLLEHALFGWAACATLMAALLAVFTPRVAVALHDGFAPLVFGVIAGHYFRPGARQPLPTALAFAGIAGVLDLLLIGGLVQHDFAIARSFTVFWLPLVLIALVTWGVGAARQMMPMARPLAR